MAQTGCVYHLALNVDNDDLPDFTLTCNGFKEALKATFGEPDPVSLLNRSSLLCLIITFTFIHRPLLPLLRKLLGLVEHPY